MASKRESRMAQIVELTRDKVVTAQSIATQQGVSCRSVYRDIASLKALGMPIEGSRGLGYMLRSNRLKGGGEVNG
ncbi:helix-turn-helix domain-containing protein [Mesorhizobium carmichaelinearum]|uniref:helix-turn-helix domain-containing protein n=1 Tax=Mesorhizobium carmichaelinearum TaxID=1208188 RepID=UPI001FCE6C80|nr:HTH domain-containing protein [Mesorhizobium carmichaelinearum]